MEDLEKLENEIVNDIKSMPEREYLSSLENEMLENDEVKHLIDEFHKSLDDYNFYLKSFGENHEFTKKYQKILYEAKLKLDLHPAVKKYNDALIKVNEPLRYLENNLISLFSRRKSC